MPAADGRPLDRTDPATVTDHADRVVVSVRSPETGAGGDDGWWIADTAWLSERMNETAYRRYLRWAHAGPVETGDEWDEFVNCGCESPQDVILRVEAVERGTAVGSETTFEVVDRKVIVDEDRIGD